jgi:hypothetical protein
MLVNACGESAVKLPQYCPSSLRGFSCPRVIRSRSKKDFPTMTRSPGTVGFIGQCAPVSSSRLIDAVAASLVFGAFSLCLAVSLTMLSIRACVAMPF